MKETTLGELGLNNIRESENICRT